MMFSSSKVLFAMFFFLTGTNIARASSPMETGSKTSQPIGHYEFCRVNPVECQETDKSDPIELTTYLWDDLIAVNDFYNHGVKPATDLELYGKEEVWTYTDVLGDCEDYVLLKRRALIEQGVPVSNLLITVVRRHDGEGHAILTVRTDQGDLILDNLEDDPKFWNETGYRYIKRQSETNSGEWVTIESQPDALTASVE